MVTILTVADTGQRSQCPFQLGDRVQMKAVFLPSGAPLSRWTGAVAHVPDPNRPIIQISRHTLGQEIGVDIDGGGRAVSNYDQWELV